MGASIRLEIVQKSLWLAGRDVSLSSSAKDWLNDLLRNWALEYKYPSLRKVGSTLTLAAGSSTVALPTDYGAGMDNLLFGDEKTPLFEKTGDEFVDLGGFPASTAGNTRPVFYMIDKQASIFRFNSQADKAYSFIPIYFSAPAAITNDNAFPWFEDDKVLIQGLIGEIYQYTEDPREENQFMKVERLKASFRRGIISSTGGPKKIRLVSNTFRPRTVILR